MLRAAIARPLAEHLDAEPPYIERDLQAAAVSLGGSLLGAANDLRDAPLERLPRAAPGRGPLSELGNRCGLGIVRSLDLGIRVDLAHSGQGIATRART